MCMYTWVDYNKVIPTPETKLHGDSFPNPNHHFSDVVVRSLQYIHYMYYSRYSYTAQFVGFFSISTFFNDVLKETGYGNQAQPKNPHR